MVRVFLLSVSSLFIVSCDVFTDNLPCKDNNSVTEQSVSQNGNYDISRNENSSIGSESLEQELIASYRDKLGAYFYWSEEFISEIEIYDDEELTMLNSIVYLDPNKEDSEENLWSFTIVHETEKAFKVFGGKTFSSDKRVHVWLKKEDVAVGILADKYAGREIPLFIEKDIHSDIVAIIKHGMIARVRSYDSPWVKVQYTDNPSDVGWLKEYQVCSSAFAPCEYVEPLFRK